MTTTEIILLVAVLGFFGYLIFRLVRKRKPSVNPPGYGGGGIENPPSDEPTDPLKKLN